MKMTTSLFAVLVSQILLSTASAQTPARPGAPDREAAAAPPVATMGTVPAATPAASATADYRLNPGDKLTIDVYKDKDLSQSLQVRPDGKITLPLVGDVAAAGRTAMQLRDAISAGLKEYIRDPVVTVIVAETAPQVIYVMGEVTHPGPQVISGQLTLMQALAMSGGFTDFANRKDIRVLHKTATGLIQTFHFNYKDAIDGGSEGPTLQPGDTVVVK
jgi:polysaccharide export outer membrane protein